jgi:hypothetical protein
VPGASRQAVTGSAEMHRVHYFVASSGISCVRLNRRLLVEATRLGPSVAGIGQAKSTRVR